MTPDEIFDSLKLAYKKASESSDKWNELNQAIIEREKIYCENIGLNKRTTADRISDVKEKAKGLKDIFSTYSFWKGEVERHSVMLSGILAYDQLKDRAKSMQ